MRRTWPAQSSVNARLRVSVDMQPKNNSRGRKIINFEYFMVIRLSPVKLGRRAKEVLPYHAKRHLYTPFLLSEHDPGSDVMTPVKPVFWKSPHLYIIDQTLLPVQAATIELASLEDVWEAIKSLRVRGAPAIGICAAYGVLVGLRSHIDATPETFRDRARRCIEYLATSRPTAVNLFYALDRMRAALDAVPAHTSSQACFAAMEAEADAQYAADIAMCRAIGDCGADLIQEGAGILTHCNAGGLATTGYGTALAPLYTAFERGRHFKVYADETRPLLQGARLTAWELQQAGIDVTLICDNMAAVIMRDGLVQAVLVGADRIAANGDTANKIGTYGVAALARLHGIPFYVAAPSTTFDLKTRTGADIPIELRDGEEIRRLGGIQTAPASVHTYNPAFDVTPGTHITAFVTDRGLLRPPYAETITHAMQLPFPAP